MKKLFLFIISLFVFLVPRVDAEVLIASKNRYYGYFISFVNGNTTVMNSYFNNGWIDDDQKSSLQILNAESSRTYVMQIGTYGICTLGTTDCWYNNIDATEFKFYEQDICVSTNKVNFKVTNASSQDFASNNHPHTIVTDEKCDLYSDSRPEGLVGPAYWEWLGDYEGYVVKVFLPIARWKSYTANNSPAFRAVSNFVVTNNSNHEIFYKFLTSGGLYDHSRWFEINNQFDIDTKNFDLTYDAVSDGALVLDREAGEKYQQSKNLLEHNTSFVSAYGVTFTYNSDGSVTVNGTATANSFFRISENLTLSPGTYTLSGGYINSGSLMQVQIKHSDGTYLFPSTNSNGSVTFNIVAGDRIDFVQIRISSGTSVNNYTFHPMLEKGSFVTDYCPFGVTLDNNCVSFALDDLLTWDSTNIINNIGNILNLPIKLSSFVIAGCNGNCSPLVLNMFNHNIYVPCGSFFWDRNDVQSFRDLWNLLIGGFIIFRLIIWDLKIIVSIFDPMANSVGFATDLIDTKSSNSKGVGD